MTIFGVEFNISILMLVFIVLLIFMFIFSLTALVTAVKLKKKYKMILRDGAGKDITDSIVNYYQKCSALMDEFKQYEERIDFIQNNIRSCAQKIGSIRYNAFGGNNSNQSFVVAVLDKENNGFVLNGVNSRQQTATYLKPITAGRAQFELSAEEIEAINIAQSNYSKIVDENKIN